MPRMQLVPKHKNTQRLKLSTTTKWLLGGGAAGLITMAGIMVATSLGEPDPLEDVVFSTSASAEVHVCSGEGVYEVEYLNMGAETFTGQEISVKLPPGYAYKAGSLKDLSAMEVAEKDISRTDSVVFSAKDLEPGETMHFSIAYTPNVAAMNDILAGNTPRNVLTLLCDQGIARDTSEAYNSLYASLSILKVNPTSKTLYTGDTTTRSMDIVNAGYGKLSSFYLTDVHPEGITLIGSSLGRLSATKDTLFFSGQDFKSMGNGDEFFDMNEKLTFSETLVATGCESRTVSSVISAFWGCGGEWVNNSSTNAHISVSLKKPDIAATSTSSMQSCFGANVPNEQSITLHNKGQGLAKNVKLDIFKSSGSDYNQNLFSRIDENSFTYQIGTNGSPQPLKPDTVVATRHDGNYACLGQNPTGRVVLLLPDMPAGQKVIIKWKQYSCCVNVCLNEKNAGWKYKLDYDDACEGDHQTLTKTGESPKAGSMSLFTESPSSIRDGQTETFTYTVSTHQNTFPQGEGAHYELVFELPPELLWSGNRQDLKWYAGPQEWEPYHLGFQNGKLTARYALPEPLNNIEKSEILLKLTGSCGGNNKGRQVALSLDINYVPDTTCANVCSMPFVCDQLVSLDLHCPDACERGGMYFRDFAIARTSFGQPDNNQDGLPDEGGSLNLSEVKTRRVMVGDSLRMTFAGLVKTTAEHPSWAYGYAASSIELGTHLSSLGATLRVYDASTGKRFSCDQLTITANVEGSTQHVYYNFSPAELGARCADLKDFVFEQGDSVWLDADYKVSGNIGGKVQEVSVTNAYYLSDVANPTAAEDKYQCDYYNGKFTLIGYFFKNASRNYVTITNCSKVVSQNYYLSIGNCCDNYDGGNLFPFEYRNWAHVKEAKVVIPPHYEILQIYTKQRRTRYTNASKTETEEPITPDRQVGDTLFFNLQQYYQPHGGSINYGDDGFRGTVYIELAPTCDVPVNEYQEMPWWFKFEKAPILGGGETEWYDCKADQIRFRPATLKMSSPNPRIDGISKTVSWNIDIQNTTSGVNAQNAWFHVKTPSGKVKIEHLIDTQSGDTIPLTGDIFKLGEVASGKTRKLELVASYSNCKVDYIGVYSGYECAGYPEKFSAFKCPYNELILYMEPKQSELQLRIDGKSVGDSCGKAVEVSVEMASVQQAHADSVQLRVSLPASGSLSYVPGSTELKYPFGGEFAAAADPRSSAHELIFNLWEYDPGIDAQGLPGVHQLDKNRLQLRFQCEMGPNFTAGENIQVSVSSQDPCGRKLPVINLAYDPSVRFVRSQNSGLTTEKGHSWSVAWGDYDNDGFEDVFVTEYATWKPNTLYHNNGDGTFTKVTEGAIVKDKGSSGGSTWGDYDNDGDLDLFVANNVQAANHLYRNDGGGKFTRVNAGAISSYGGYCHNAAWVDYDNDGHLDLFATDFMPTRFNVLYHNKGDGTFEQVETNPIALEANFSLGATWGDYDNDGLPDLFVPNSRNNNNSLYHNEGGGNFTKITQGAIVNDGGSSTGCSWGDYDNDGDLDLYVTNASNQVNFFYENNGDGSFTKITDNLIVQAKGQSHGSSWADVNNDGWLDLFIANDADNNNVLFINNGDKTFSKVENIVSQDLENSMGNAWADYDNDGDLDLYVANKGMQKNTLYTNNRGGCNNYICFMLEGTKSNRSGIGAKVRIKATINGRTFWQMREVSSQTGGTSAQSTMRVMFGLGNASAVDSVKVEWPSGMVQYLTHQEVNQCNTIVEEEGFLVYGKAFDDANRNGKYDENEAGIPGMKIEITPGPKYVTTDKYGDYKVYLPYDDYELAQKDNATWRHSKANNLKANMRSLAGPDQVTICHIASTESQTMTIPATALDAHLAHGDRLGPCEAVFGPFNFADTAVNRGPDLRVALATTVLRRGFRNTFAINYSNEGTQTAKKVDLKVTFDRAIIPLSADREWAHVLYEDSTATYTWSLDSVSAGKAYTIMVTDSVSRTAPLGKMAMATAVFANVQGDYNTANNRSTDYNEIVGAIDPNDKLVYPPGIVRKGDTLTYKIRFQNVGNYHASRVIIHDTISPDLDLSSFVEGPVSHQPCKVSINGRVITWRFDNIYLPDSVHDEPNSHGFVQFKILPSSEMPNGYTFKNKAAIQFDYNDFIITNTTENRIGDPRKMAQDKLLKLVVAPNPVKTQAMIRVINQEDGLIATNITRLQVYNTAGTRVYDLGPLNHPEVKFMRENLPSGVYIVRVYDRYGFSYAGKMVVK